MDLVVARDAPAVRTVDQAGAAYARSVLTGKRHRATDQPYAMGLGEPREARLLGSVTVDLADRELVGRMRTEDAEIFGQHDELRARRRRLVDQGLDRAEVRRDVAARLRLHRSDAHFQGGSAH